MTWRHRMILVACGLATVLGFVLVRRLRGL